MSKLNELLPSLIARNQYAFRIGERQRSAMGIVWRGHLTRHRPPT
jgi:hypothetical protein